MLIKKCYFVGCSCVCVLKRGLITFKHRLRVCERRVLLEEASVTQWGAPRFLLLAK